MLFFLTFPPELDPIQHVIGVGRNNQNTNYRRRHRRYTQPAVLSVSFFLFLCWWTEKDLLPSLRAEIVPPFTRWTSGYGWCWRRLLGALRRRGRFLKKIGTRTKSRDTRKYQTILTKNNKSINGIVIPQEFCQSSFPTTKR